MKLQDTTNPATNTTSHTLFNLASAHQQLGIVSRFRANVLGMYFNGDVDERWGSSGKRESDCLHHLEIAFSGHRQVVFNNEVMDLLPGRAYWFPGNTPLERRWKLRSEVLYLKLQCEWLPGIDPFLDWPNRRPKLVGSCDLDYWCPWLRPDFSPTTNHLMSLHAWVLDSIAKVIPDLNGIIAQHLKTHAKFDAVFALIEKKLHCGLRIEELAQAHGTSLHAFSMAFTRNIGLTPKAYLKRRLNQEAILLVMNTDLKIKEIADRLKFYDEYHFSRFFTQMNGKPPSRYRMSLQQKTINAARAKPKRPRALMT